MRNTRIMVVLMTPAPAGPDQRATGGIDRSQLSSMGHIAEYQKLKWDDFCEKEMADGIKRRQTGDCEVIPL